jgi:hypothetical protein
MFCAGSVLNLCSPIYSIWWNAASTHDQYVFSFYEDHHPCEGFADALTRYRQIVPNLKLAGMPIFSVL